MNYLRPIFKFLFALVVIALFSYAALQLWHGAHPAISWLGLWLAAAAPLLFLILKQFFARYTQSLQGIGFSTLCGLGLAITMASSWKHGDVAGNAHLGAGLCLVLWFLYRRWFVQNPVTEQTDQAG
jgi:hypothetical protein